MMCKFNNLLMGGKCEQPKNEFEDKYILGNQTLKQIANQIHYVEHKIIKPIEGIINIQSILLIYVERYKFI